MSKRKLKVVEDSKSVVPEVVAPEAPKFRDEAAINQDYANLCSQIGDAIMKRIALEQEAQRQVADLNGKIDAIRARIEDLNKEMEAMKAAKAVK